MSQNCHCADLWSIILSKRNAFNPSKLGEFSVHSAQSAHPSLTDLMHWTAKSMACSTCSSYLLKSAREILHSSRNCYIVCVSQAFFLRSLAELWRVSCSLKSFLSERSVRQGRTNLIQNFQHILTQAFHVDQHRFVGGRYNAGWGNVLSFVGSQI